MCKINSQRKKWLFQENLPLVVVTIILFIDIRDGNESTNSCGNSPVVDQNVWDLLNIQNGISIDSTYNEQQIQSTLVCNKYVFSMSRTS